MQIIPLNPTPSQSVDVVLAGQFCQVNVYQKAFGLFLDLFVSNALVVAGAPCLDLTLIVRSAYLGFDGDLCFLDGQGDSDPDYTGLGSRFSLAYLDADDVASIPGLAAGAS